MFTPKVGTTYRINTAESMSFGVGTVTQAALGVATLTNRNDEVLTLPGDCLQSLPPLVSDNITQSVAAIKAQLTYLMASAQIPYVRTFADLHDHMDANILLINHVPEIFPRDADGDLDERQTDMENRVSELVNKWLIENWDNDPFRQPAPTESAQVASILAAMLDMSLEEQQWGNAPVVEVLPETNPDEISLLVGVEQFTITVKKTTTPTPKDA